MSHKSGGAEAMFVNIKLKCVIIVTLLIICIFGLDICLGVFIKPVNETSPNTTF